MILCVYSRLLLIRHYYIYIFMAGNKWASSFDLDMFGNNNNNEYKHTCGSMVPILLEIIKQAGNEKTDVSI